MKDPTAKSAAFAGDRHQERFNVDYLSIPSADWDQRTQAARVAELNKLKGRLETLVAESIKKAEKRLPGYRGLKARARLHAWSVPFGSAVISILGIVSIANLGNAEITGAASLSTVLISTLVGAHGIFKPASDAEYHLMRTRMFITRHEAIHDKRTREWDVFVDHESATYEAYLNALSILSNTIDDLKLAATSDDIDIRDPMAVAKTIILKPAGTQ